MQQHIMPVGQMELHLAQIALWPGFLGEAEVANIDAGPIDLGGIYRIALLAHRERVLSQDRVVLFTQSRQQGL